MDNAGLSSYGSNYFDKKTGFFWKITPEGKHYIGNYSILKKSIKNISKPIYRNIPLFDFTI